MASTRRRTRRTPRRTRSTRRPRHGRGTDTARITVRRGRLRYRPKANSTPRTFSTAVAKRAVRSPRTRRGQSLRATRAICKRMRVPRQHSSNCWLNAALMSFFTSEGMHSATRAIRAALVDPPRNIPTKLRRELRQLGLVIHSIPKGILTPQYSTAQLIPTLNAADRAGLTTPRNRLGAPQGDAHNPVWFFTALASLLLPLEYSVARVDLSRPGGSGVHPDLSAALAVPTRHNATHKTPPPRVLLIEAGQESAGSRARMELTAAVAAGRSIAALGRKWVLDSLTILDASDTHFGGVITCAAEPHTYDGITGSRVHPKRSWKEIMERLVNKPIPTPSREEFRYDVRTGYVTFAFVPAKSSSGRQH
jgi:hypothetical protein